MLAGLDWPPTLLILSGAFNVTVRLTGRESDEEKGERGRMHGDAAVEAEGRPVE